MPPRNERIAAMVLREISKNPQIGNDVLLEKAVVIDRAVRRLSPRQFHATYRLPALRTVSASAQAGQAGAPSPRAPKPATPTATAPTASAAAVPMAAPSTPATEAPATGDAPAAPHAPSPHTTSPHTTSPHATSPHATSPRAHAPSTSTAVGRPHAAEREAVRQILQLVAREALVTEDRAAFVRLLDSLDERSAMILGLFGRS